MNARSTLARLRRIIHADSSARWELWRQHRGGADAFTSPQHPGVTLTQAQLRDTPPALGALRITVVRGEG